MKLRMLFLFFLMCLLFIPSVGATSNQGLYWGVVENQIITYDIEIKENFDSSISEESYQIYVGVVELPDIPADVSSVDDVDHLARTDAVYINGSDIPSPIEFDLFAIVESFVLPAGNWTLMYEIYGTYFNIFGSDVFPDNPSYWGYNITHDLLPPYRDLNIAATYTKADGVLERLQKSVTNTDDETFTVIVERIPDYPIGIVLAIVLIGAIAVVVVVVIIIKRR